jgi:hypothetical protein
LFTCYLDESGTDSNSQIAVLGGLILNMSQFFWLDVEWRKHLDFHRIPWPLHMKEFGEHGKLKHITASGRSTLFADLVRTINDNKSMSVASTLNTEQYRRVFDGVNKLSMYGASFMQLAILNGIGAEQGGFKGRIAYVLDTGNHLRPEVAVAHSVANEGERPLNAGMVTFDSDDNVCALQAADVISWSVRRRMASKLKSGFEPLADLFDEKHIELEYKDNWMADVADMHRIKRGP